MTIDEAITHAREVAKEHRDKSSPYGELLGNDSDCIKCAEDHEQIAEWLEELKELRQFKNESEDKLCNAIYEAETSIYNKALEDYHRLISEECKSMLIKINPYASHLKDYNDKVLERLKAGGNL